MNQQNGGYEVGLELNDEGAQKFADATGKYIGQNISIYLDDEEISSARVNSQISGGKASIETHDTLQKNKELAGMINAGALPLPVKEVSVSNVGAELGATAFPNSVKAGIIGVGLVFLFMLFHYRIQGLMAKYCFNFVYNTYTFCFYRSRCYIDSSRYSGILAYYWCGC